MRRIVLLVPAILLAAACSSGTPSAAPTVDGSVPVGKPAASKMDAAGVFKDLAAAVPTAS